MAAEEVHHGFLAPHQNVWVKVRVGVTLLKVPILLKPAKDAGSNKNLEKGLAKNALGFFTPTTASATAIQSVV